MLSKPLSLRGNFLVIIIILGRATVASKGSASLREVVFSVICAAISVDSLRGKRMVGAFALSSSPFLVACRREYSVEAPQNRGRVFTVPNTAPAAAAAPSLATGVPTEAAIPRR